MTLLARVMLAALAWGVVIGLGVYVHPGWYGLAPLAIAATYTPPCYTPGELERMDARSAALQAGRDNLPVESQRNYYPGSGGTL